MANRPAAEVDVSEALVRSLLREQAPDLADGELRMADRGWDNTNWRLGDDLLVRIPHRAVAAPLIEHEQQWLPVLQTRFDEVAIPSPIVAGAASESVGFPWPWSVVPWYQGTEAAGAVLKEPAATAAQLGRFLAQLHQSAPDDAPPNPHRGDAIRTRKPHYDERCESLRDRIDADTARALFERALEAPDTTERVWLHGDMHTRNMVVHDGDLTAIIDWGDICAGDRATDLAGAFMLTPEHVDVVAGLAGADGHAWERARGWALHFAALYLTHAQDDPAMANIGIRLFRALGVETA